MRIFGEIPFIKLQNDTKITGKSVLDKDYPEDLHVVFRPNK